MDDANPLHLNFNLTPKQASVLESKATEILYGGAASGGKSHMTRILAILWALEIPGIQIFIFRRLYDDLVKNHLEGPTGFRALLAPWLNATHPKSPLTARRLCEIVEGEIRFWNGSKIFLCHLQHQKDITKYYGVEIHVLFLEEATQFAEPMIRFLRSRMRIPKALKIPDKYKKPESEWASPDEPSYYFPRAVYTSNPGGVGHLYLKNGFASKPPFEYYKAPSDDGGHVRQFIPARVDDNPYVNRAEVKRGLSGLPPTLVDALLNGNWNAVIGAFFPEIHPDVHLIKWFQIPAHWTRLMSMDWGSCGEADPFSIGWWAVSDGVNTPYPRGSLICYRSWYGKGLAKVTASYVAKNLQLIEGKWKDKITYRVAGGDIDEKKGHGESIKEIFAKFGIIFNNADKRRQPSHIQMRERLVGVDGKPMIYWFEKMADELDTIASLQHDPHNPNECSSKDDHVYEQTRYVLMTRPWVRPAPPQSKKLEEHFAAPSIDELWKLRDQQSRIDR